MKKLLLYTSLLLFPFLVMIVTNELVRLQKTEKGYPIKGVTAINSVKKSRDYCSWICHNHTPYCKEQHVKWVQPYFEQIDPVYLGIINALRATGDYGGANVIFLVILIPGLLYFLLIRIIGMQMEINQLKQRK